MQLNMEAGLLHTDKTWRQDYYIQLNMEAELVNLIGSNLQATNIQQGGSYIGWTFFLYTLLTFAFRPKEGFSTPMG